MKTTLLSLATLVLTLGSAAAHSVWIEPLPSGELVLRFAEWGEDFEKSPGALDSLTSARVLTPENVTASMKADHILLEKSHSTQNTVASTGFTVMKRGGTARLPLFHARWWSAGAGKGAPLTKLDLIPGEKSDEVVVYFDGKPLGAGIELELNRPTGDSIKLLTNDKGVVILPRAVEKGLHQLALPRYSENKPGEFQGTAYEVTSHNASLTWLIREIEPGK